MGDSKGSAAINGLNGEFGGAFQMGTQIINGLNTALVGNEKTGGAAETMAGVGGLVSSVASQINPLGGLTNSVGTLAGNLIGGTKNRVAGAGSEAVNMASSVASMFGPIGMVAGFGLNLLNGIGGSRVETLADRTDEISNEYGASKKNISDDIAKYSGKKAGLFDFGFGSKGNIAIRNAREKQRRLVAITKEGERQRNNQIGQDLMLKNSRIYSGGDLGYSLARKGMKLPELDKARELLLSFNTKQEQSELPKFQIGGKLNLIPEGSLHSHKHEIVDSNPELKGQITEKGIPVVMATEEGVQQCAEIEKNEWTLRKEFTDQLEALYAQYKDNPSDDIAIEAGKLIIFELLKNTDDRTGLIKSVK